MVAGWPACHDALAHYVLAHYVFSHYISLPRELTYAA
jgi:hypothetical protein